MTAEKQRDWGVAWHVECELVFVVFSGALDFAALQAQRFVDQTIRVEMLPAAGCVSVFIRAMFKQKEFDGSR